MSTGNVVVSQNPPSKNDLWIQPRGIVRFWNGNIWKIVSNASVNDMDKNVNNVISGYYHNNNFYIESTHETEIEGRTETIFIDLSKERLYRWDENGYTELNITKLDEAITSVINCGGITEGTELSAETTFHDFVDKLLRPFQKPLISLSISPSGTREVGNVVSSVTLTATVTKRTANIANVKFYIVTGSGNNRNLTEIGTDTTSTTSNGNLIYSYTHTPSSAISSNIKFIAIVTDNASPNASVVESNEASISFANYIYVLQKATSSQTAPSTSSDIHNISTKDWYKQSWSIQETQVKYGVWVCCPSGYKPRIITSSNDDLQFVGTNCSYTYNNGTTTTYTVWYCQSATENASTYNKITFSNA